jgi:hypothetical protein
VVAEAHVTNLHGVVNIVRSLLSRRPDVGTSGNAEPTLEPESERLIDRLDVLVDAYCPCGSTHLHHLTLVSTSECARCGRTLAIRSIHYARTSPWVMPTPQVSVGYVFTPESLRSRQTAGVH